MSVVSFYCVLHLSYVFECSTFFNMSGILWDLVFFFGSGHLVTLGIDLERGQHIVWSSHRCLGLCPPPCILTPGITAAPLW